MEKQSVSELTRIAENGNGCDLTYELKSLSHAEQIEVWKKIVKQNELNRLGDPTLPKLTLSYEMPLQKPDSIVLSHDPPGWFNKTALLSKTLHKRYDKSLDIQDVCRQGSNEFSTRTY